MAADAVSDNSGTKAQCFEVPISVPGLEGATAFKMNAGDVLFLLGANGSGKSGLVHRLHKSIKKSERIAAHRSNFFASETIGMSPKERDQNERSIRVEDAKSEARWKEANSWYKTLRALHRMVDRINRRAHEITAAVDAGDTNLVRKLRSVESPLIALNRILELANLPISISIADYAELHASRSGSPPYSVARLSDGERNALIIACAVLTAEAGTAMLIDEPERHLHPSIVNPFLTQLFRQRPDLVFLVSTHDVSLPVTAATGSTLLVRGCAYRDNEPIAWDCDLVGLTEEIPADIKTDVLGARRKMLFIEGTDSSLDKPMYALLFPGVTVVPKNSCGDVERAVKALRDAADLTWLTAWGLVDNDKRTDADIAILRSFGVYCLPHFSIESLYYAPTVQKMAAERLAQVVGGDVEARCIEASDATLRRVAQHVERMAGRIIEKAVREEILNQIPGATRIAAGAPVSFSIDIASKISAAKMELQSELENRDVAAIIRKYPIRETGALDAIAKALGFTDRRAYESSVLRLLAEDSAALAHVKGMLPSDSSDISGEMEAG